MKVKRMYIICIVMGVLIGVFFYRWRYNKLKNRYEKSKILEDKHLEMFLLYDRWIQNKQNGKKIGDYFEENGLKQVVIYGVSYIGKRLFKELNIDGIEVKYLVDQKQYEDIDGKEVIQIRENMDSVDAVIVTSIYYFEDIEDELKGKFKCPILSLGDIIYKV